MDRQSTRTTKALPLVAGLLIACLLIGGYCFLKPKTGKQLFPEIGDATSVQVLHPRFQNSSGAHLEGAAMETFIALLCQSEYSRELSSSSGMDGNIYIVYAYVEGATYSADHPPCGFKISDQGILYPNSTNFFCYKILSDDVLNYLTALDA